MSKWKYEVEPKTRYDINTGKQLYSLPDHRISDGDGTIACLVNSSTAASNGHLIAAAPELLIACEGALAALIFDPHVSKSQAIVYLKEVISRAKGESNAKD